MVKLARHLKLAAAQGLDGAGFKRGLGELGHVEPHGLGSSASVSLEPRVALPVSTVKVILLVASLAGSKATWASNFLK